MSGPINYHYFPVAESGRTGMHDEDERHTR